ncbi:AraC family transcriptional regulator [Mangrovibacterium lignilyticum]|uniref:AraC family transcriptional regulator n=1 Tax=Mangrovibacterium lignilyticum TaxID=2668052 RepID=UPI0013D725E2|nr:AraC family transcriptional regulator [Mangrovibacterium lignilyticum]
MKIMHEKVSFTGNNSLNIKWDDFPHFTFPWHFHTEYELVYVIKSFGKRFVADHAEDFTDGDLVLLGPKLPHFWKNDEVFFQNDPNYKVNALVIHFPADFFSQQLEEHPEFSSLKKLLQDAKRGIHFSSTTAAQLDKKFRRLLKLKGFELTIAFLSLLNELAKKGNYRLLASKSYQPDLQNWSGNRMDKIMFLMNSNYRRQLKLEDIAAEIGMNPTAFCRYFKEKTGKSFIQLINEMRVGYACKLLQENKMSVSEIGFTSGFNNLSNFNRCFKKNTGHSPLSYRNQFIHAHP